MDDKRLMVVDDEPELQALYQRVLAVDGYVVTLAGSAEEALELQNRDPLMVHFLDLKLPGMSGVELCRRLRADWPMAVCIAVTGHASMFELSACREAGFDDYFTKPVAIADLRQAAAQAFARVERWRGH